MKSSIIVICIFLAFLFACTAKIPDKNSTKVSPIQVSTTAIVEPTPSKNYTPTTFTGTEQIESTSDPNNIIYLWPSDLPNYLFIKPEYSVTDSSGYLLDTNVSGGRQITFAGGSRVASEYIHVAIPPYDTDYQAITVRGVKGQVNKPSHGTGVRLFWQENNTNYALLAAGMSLDEVLDVAEGLISYDLNQLQQHLSAITTPTVTPSGPLVYFWPTWLPEGLTFSPSNSFGDETGFVLEYEKPFALLSINGGSTETKSWHYYHEGGTPIIVRGQEGYYYSTGAGFGIEWRENGHPFFVGGPMISLEDVTQMAERLEIIDLATFQKRLK